MKIKKSIMAITMLATVSLNAVSAQAENVMIPRYENLKYGEFMKEEYKYIPISLSNPFSDYARNNPRYGTLEMYFEDIKQTDWFYEDAVFNNKTGFITGKGQVYLLAPQDKLTRAELVAIVQRWYADSATVVVTNNFSDLSNTHWAYQNMLKAIGSGYLSGYEDGTARPDANITRAEVASILERYIRDEFKNRMHIFKENEFENQYFIDVPNDHWATNSIKFVANVLGFYGYEDGSFKPSQEITRAEMIALNTRLINLKMMHLIGKPE